MQKNEAGFKMAFKKRNPEFKKPPKKFSATIPASGDLRRHDQPTRAMKHSNDSSESSSDEDILEKKRKEELEHQKTEQAKLVEMALLEQVMSGQLDVLKLLKSGEIENSSIKEKLQKQMLLDGVPNEPAPPGVEASPVKQTTPRNPLMRNRLDSDRDTKSKSRSQEPSNSKQKKNKVKSSGSISSESSEESSLSDSDISSESDSDEDAHKLSKKVKKLKSKNKKLEKKVKLLKKKLKEKKSDKSDKTDSSKSSAVKRNSHGQIMDNTPKTQPPPPQQTGAAVPMTPQQYATQQSQLQRVYDPQTGQYRLVRGTGEIVEEIVSKDRHNQLNKMATQSDGQYFQRQTFAQNYHGYY